MRRPARSTLVTLAAALAILDPLPAAAAPVFLPAERAVSGWRDEAAANLALAPERAAVLRDAAAPAPPVARCVKLNNYWCIKKAGWTGEIASDGEGHVAFRSAREGAAVAALLLRRYYVDLGLRTARSIVRRWAPPGCGVGTRAVVAGGSLGTLTAIAGALRARWLSGRVGAAAAGAGRTAPGTAAEPARRSEVADSAPKPAGPAPRAPANRAMTLDALLASTPGLPPSRSMIGMGRAPSRPPRPAAAPERGDARGDDADAACADDGARVAAYAARAAAGIAAGPDDALALFAADGTPTASLARLMRNMAAVEIGPAEVSAALVAGGIADAFRPGRGAR